MRPAAAAKRKNLLTDEANLAFVSDQPPLDLANPDWVIHTQSADRPPVRFEAGARIERSLVANGCRVAGQVTRSVLFPGVTVGPGAVLSDCIVMNDSVVGREAVVDRAILDKSVVVGSRAHLGHGDATTPNRACPEHLSSGLTVVGKGARIPEGITVGRNARIGAHVVERQFDGHVPAGGVIHGPDPEH